MFGRKVPKQSDGKPSGTPPAPAESDRITSYRVDQDAAPPITGVSKTTSYVNSMQFNARGYETLN
jgi:hypothetical protein